VRRGASPAPGGRVTKGSQRWGRGSRWIGRPSHPPRGDPPAARARFAPQNRTARVPALAGLLARPRPADLCGRPKITLDLADSFCLKFPRGVPICNVATLLFRATGKQGRLAFCQGRQPAASPEPSSPARPQAPRRRGSCPRSRRSRYRHSLVCDGLKRISRRYLRRDISAGHPRAAAQGDLVRACASCHAAGGTRVRRPRRLPLPRGGRPC
jgi:hypothetical protein